MCVMAPITARMTLTSRNTESRAPPTHTEPGEDIAMGSEEDGWLWVQDTASAVARETYAEASSAPTENPASIEEMGLGNCCFL